MKKILSTLLAFLFLALSVAPAAAAVTADDPNSTRPYVKRDASFDITRTEIELMRYELNVRELLGKSLTIEPLYDANDKPSFLLGVTELGSAIIYRENGSVYECGQFSPYVGFEPCKKYYGGALSYYVRRSDNAEFRNLMTGAYEELSQPFIFEVTAERGIVGESASTVTIRLKNEHFISGYAFCYNAEGTCSAVASSLVLVYLRLQCGFPVVAWDKVPERHDGYNPSDKWDCYNYYPKAYNLHERLLQFNLGTATFGGRVTGPLNNYFKATISELARRPVVSSHAFPSFISVAQELAAKKPVMVTTKVFASQYPRHTMAVYGCRQIPGFIFNTNEVLVHQGWYGKEYFTQVGSYFRQKDYWLNFGNVWYGYFFSLPGYN